MRDICKKKIINAPVSAVWRQWTTSEGLKTFFGPENKIELIPGGAFEIYFQLDNPYGIRGSEGCKILSYLHERMLSFSWNAPPQYPEIRNSEYSTWVVVEFNETEDRKTEVVLTHTGWPFDDSWQPVHSYFDDAWNIVIDRLAQSHL